MDFCSDSFILKHKSLKQRIFVSSLSLCSVLKKKAPHLLVCIYDNFKVLGSFQDDNELILIHQEQNNSIIILFSPTLYSQGQTPYEDRH